MLLLLLLATFRFLDKGNVSIYRYCAHERITYWDAIIENWLYNVTRHPSAFASINTHSYKLLSESLKTITFFQYELTHSQHRSVQYSTAQHITTKQTILHYTIDIYLTMRSYMNFFLHLHLLFIWSFVFSSSSSSSSFSLALTLEVF